MAYAVQTIVALSAVAAVVWLWSRRALSLDIKAAALAAALLLVSPYFFASDMVVLAIPIALLARQGLRHGFLPYEKTFLFSLWLLPLLVKTTSGPIAFPVTPLMLGGLLFLCVKKGRDASAA